MPLYYLTVCVSQSAQGGSAGSPLDTPKAGIEVSAALRLLLEAPVVSQGRAFQLHFADEEIEAERGEMAAWSLKFRFRYRFPDAPLPVLSFLCSLSSPAHLSFPQEAHYACCS